MFKKFIQRFSRTRITVTIKQVDGKALYKATFVQKYTLQMLLMGIPFYQNVLFAEKVPGTALMQNTIGHTPWNSAAPEWIKRNAVRLHRKCIL